MMTPDRLCAFFDAWNDHDVETIVSYFTPDGAYDASIGPDDAGTAFHGISPAGEPMTYRGVDLFAFEGDLISIKDAYRKERSRPIGG